jgi:hypothetical protein
VVSAVVGNDTPHDPIPIVVAAAVAAATSSAAAAAVAYTDGAVRTTITHLHRIVVVVVVTARLVQISEPVIPLGRRRREHHHALFRFVMLEVTSFRQITLQFCIEMC